MIEDAVRLINGGNCLLFVGSGFSVSATNVEDKPVPSSSGLVEHFLDIADIFTERSEYDLETASEKAFGSSHEKEAFRYLSRALRCKKTSDAQKTICSRSWRRIYTTNYDDVLEQGNREAGKSYNSLTLDSKFDDRGSDTQQIVHIHGSVQNLDQSHFKQDFYLTDAQGLDIRFIKSFWNRHFLDDIVFSDAVFL